MRDIETRMKKVEFALYETEDPDFRFDRIYKKLEEVDKAQKEDHLYVQTYE